MANIGIDSHNKGTATTATSITVALNHGANVFVVAYIMWWPYSTRPFSSITCGGVAMTEIGTELHYSTANLALRAHGLYRTAAANENIVFTVASGNFTGCACLVVAFTYAASSAPFTESFNSNSNNSTNDISVAVAAGSAGRLVVFFGGNDASTRANFLPSAGETTTDDSLNAINAECSDTYWTTNPQQGAATGHRTWGAPAAGGGIIGFGVLPLLVVQTTTDIDWVVADEAIVAIFRWAKKALKGIPMIPWWRGRIR